MISDIHNYLKIFVTENGIPLNQVLTETDLVQLSVTISQLTTPKAEIDFKAVSNNIFRALEVKGELSILHTISTLLFTFADTPEENMANKALLGYMCLQYFSVVHDLPIEKILFVVNDYMSKHIVEQTETHNIDCSNPMSNLIPINDTQYVRYTGKTIIPPKASIKEDFIKQLNSLLIK